jgi:hypothetical protein
MSGKFSCALLGHESELLTGAVINQAVIYKFYMDVDEDDEAWQDLLKLANKLQINLDWKTLIEEWV